MTLVLFPLHTDLGVPPGVATTDMGAHTCSRLPVPGYPTNPLQGNRYEMLQSQMPAQFHS